MIFQPFWLILVFNSAVTIQVLPLKFKKNTLNYSDSTVKNNHENKMIIRGPKRGKRKKNKQKRSSNIQHPTSSVRRPLVDLSRWGQVGPEDGRVPVKEELEENREAFNEKKPKKMDEREKVCRLQLSCTFKSAIFRVVREHVSFYWPMINKRRLQRPWHVFPHGI